MRYLLILPLMIQLAASAFAVQPDEILKDAGLETRARAISAGLRCLVCQNQSIDDSDASVARDLRILIREQLVQGKSDEEVVDFVVARYGDFVLLKPRFTAHTAILWLAPFLALALGALFLWRRRAPATTPESLTADEKAEVEKLLKP